MNFEFEIENKTINQVKTCHIHNKDLKKLFCFFTFMTKDWKHLEKYAIFWSKKGQSTVRSLGTANKTKCPIPQNLLNDLYFYVQVYANDKILTSKIKVFVRKQVPQKPKEDFEDFFIHNKKNIDNIIYDDNKLLIFGNNKLIKTINIVDEGLLEKIFSGTAPKYIVDVALSPESDLPVANKVIYEALEEKLDKTSLSTVATTGSYNDLLDIPNEFNPSPHTHVSDDIEDLDDSIDEDLDNFLDVLIENM